MFTVCPFKSRSMSKYELASVPSVEDLQQEAITVFQETFGSFPSSGAFAPGRVNLIGEHTDYNYGYVFPMALPLGTVAVGRKNKENKCRILTTADRADDPKFHIFPLPTSDNPYMVNCKPKWSNYVKGVIANFHGYVESFDAVFISSVPLGSGVSSSASLQVATYILLEQLHGGPNPHMTIIDKVLACEDAEHEYAGLPSGIMDQYISMTGEEGFAHLIDCRSLESKPLAFRDKEVSVIITNSNVYHELTDTPYANRQQQCEMAAKLMGVKNLREITEENLVRQKDKLDEETFRRVRHVLSENARTIDAASALENKDYERLGKLMVESQNSLRYDFEVSCQELDQLVGSAMEVDGVYGSRLTGGGFGGCTVTLVKTQAVEVAIKHMAECYKGTATFYVCSPSAGAKPLHISNDVSEGI